MCRLVLLGKCTDFSFSKVFKLLVPSHWRKIFLVRESGGWHPGNSPDRQKAQVEEGVAKTIVPRTQPTRFTNLGVFSLSLNQ